MVARRLDPTGVLSCSPSAILAGFTEAELFNTVFIRFDGENTLTSRFLVGGARIVGSHDDLIELLSIFGRWFAFGGLYS